MIQTHQITRRAANLEGWLVESGRETELVDLLNRKVKNKSLRFETADEGHPKGLIIRAIRTQGNEERQHWRAAVGDWITFEPDGTFYRWHRLQFAKFHGVSGDSQAP